MSTPTHRSLPLACASLPVPPLPHVEGKSFRRRQLLRKVQNSDLISLPRGTRAIDELPVCVVSNCYTIKYIFLSERGGERGGGGGRGEVQFPGRLIRVEDIHRRICLRENETRLFAVFSVFLSVCLSISVNGTITYRFHVKHPPLLCTSFLFLYIPIYIHKYTLYTIPQTLYFITLLSALFLPLFFLLPPHLLLPNASSPSHSHET